MEWCSALVFVLLVSAATVSSDPRCGGAMSGVPVFHIYGNCSPLSKVGKEGRSGSWVKTVMDMASKDPERVHFLSNLETQKTTTRVSAPIASGQQVLNIGNYLVQVQVGSPGQLMFMVLDTSHDTTWLPCSGCAGCSSFSFSPNASATFAGPLECGEAQCSQARGTACPSSSSSSPCTFNQSYGGDSSLTATLVEDTLTLGSSFVQNYTLGCIEAVSGKSIPPQGLLGLGRGPLSLLSQADSLYGGVFSYCLPSFKSYYFSGSLKLGAMGQPKSIKTTPLLRNSHRPSLYYVNLTGVSVGRVKLEELPLSFDPTTGAGTIVDSGTVITRFVEPLYSGIRDEFRKQLGLTTIFTSLGAFDTCFNVTHERVAPTVTLHFSSLNLALPMENTLIHSSSGALACLAMAASPANSSVLNIFATLQQQNLRILFDLPNSRLGISHELCN